MGTVSKNVLYLFLILCHRIQTTKEHCILLKKNNFSMIMELVPWYNEQNHAGLILFITQKLFFEQKCGPFICSKYICLNHVTPGKYFYNIK